MSTDESRLRGAQRRIAEAFNDYFDRFEIRVLPVLAFGGPSARAVGRSPTASTPTPPGCQPWSFMRLTG